MVNKLQNMFFIIILFSNLEFHAVRCRFISLYFVSGLMKGGKHFFFEKDSETVVM